LSEPLDPPFGTYALPPDRERWRKKADDHKDSRIGRLMISRARKRALAGQSGPFDVDINDAIVARLYPKTNRCEKRAFAGVQIWDAKERGALEQAVNGSDRDPFIFIDVGANVGLYSLFVNSYAKAAGKKAHIIAIEPDLENCARLEDNIKANNADIHILRAAVSDQPGMAYLSGGEINRGEVKLAQTGQPEDQVVVDTLTRIIRTLGITKIDAIKLDIEGHDYKAMKTFFEDTAPMLHPRIIIAETGNPESAPLIELCKEHKYMVSERTKLNSVFIKENHAET